MLELASYIKVPATELSEGRVYATAIKDLDDFPDLIHIYSGRELSAVDLGNIT